jgi:hypothetical protein
MAPNPSAPTTAAPAAIFVSLIVNLLFRATPSSAIAGDNSRFLGITLA